MSRGLSAAGSSHRSYGATNTSPLAEDVSGMPDVGFAGFSPTELYSLSENITTNIYTVNSSWRNLERLLRNIGTHKDNQGLRDKVHVTQLSTNQIVSATSKDLHRLTVVVRRGDKQQKLQVEKLTNDFKDAVARYSDMQKMVADKMKTNLLLQQVSADLDAAEGETTEEQARLIQTQRNENNELKFQNEMLIEREARVRQIEADVLDVNQIMRELGSLVYQQQEDLDSIEGSIEAASGNVEQGNSELIKAAQYQAKFRRKMLILLVIALLIGLIITAILISQLKR